jgi:4-aminobutyrate aminotransferase-like enzyme/Ser/Thr protein kinase RdoA (MazF antagonist)
LAVTGRAHGEHPSQGVCHDGSVSSENPFLGHEHRRPDVEADEALVLLEHAFGRTGTLHELGSHQDRNFRVDTPQGGRLVLKVARQGISRAELDAENEAMLVAAAAGLPFEIPVPQRALDGALVVRVTAASGAAHDLRLLTYLDGEPLDGCGYLAPAVLQAHGAMAARMSLALEGWDHAALDRELQWDLRFAAHVVEALARFTSTPARRGLAERESACAAAALERLAPDLRVRAIHADVTDVNTVARRDGAGRPMPAGLIDFGDLSRTWVASDLAVTIAADSFHALEHPLQLARDVARGFIEVLPLTEAELAAVWPMVVARAASVAVSGDQQAALEPDNAYVQAVRDEEWAALEAVAAVPYPLAEAVLREAAGLGPARRLVVPVDAAPPVALDGRLVKALDLSTTSERLAGSATGNPERIGELVAAVREDGLVPVGRWGEARLTDVELDATIEAATVHLGVDLYLPPDAVVRAPVSGVVRHTPAGLVLGTAAFDIRLDGVVPDVAPGATVDAGDAVGGIDRVGPLDRPSMVHVQVVLAPGLEAPRRAIPSLADAWLQLCPDPSPLLGLPVGLAVAPPDDAAALLERRSRVLAATQEHYYQAPPRIERGWRQHLVDTRGRARVDVVNNVAVLGHSHPAVERAVRRQLARLNTNSRFLYGVMVGFAEALAARFPAPLETVFLVNTGSEANELALRLARTATGNDDVLAVRGAYHGWTGATDAITTSLLDNPRALVTRPGWVRLVEAPNTYRGPHRGPDAGDRYADDVRAVLLGLAGEGRAPAAFIAEPLFGNAGGIVLPHGYLAQVYRDVRAAGGLAIADEVQTGYGRLGAYQWAFEQQGVVPDIVSVAKAAGNGIAVGAVVTTRAIADAFASEGSFFSSIGGSPVGCAAGLAVLETIDRERLQENARVVGGHLKSGLEDVAGRHPEIVGTVHGMGLYLGVELVRDRVSLEPASEEALAICERMLELGVIVQPTGDGNNVLKVKPPLCITRESADLVVDALERTLSDGW